MTRLEELPGWPGAGTLTLPASEAHAFTVYEVARPRMAQVEEALASQDRERGDGRREAWLVKLADELRALLAAPDRPLSPDDLKFAATARCRCGAGYCYVKWVHDSHGLWACSAIFLGTADAESEHDQCKPFAFWSIKGEGQPSANEATTRPSTPTGGTTP